MYLRYEYIKLPHNGLIVASTTLHESSKKSIGSE